MEVKDIISSGLLELYVTGSASAEETLQVEQWAEQYPEVKKEIEDLQQVMEIYAMAEAVQPDEGLKEKILGKIQPDESVKDKIFARIQNPQEPFSVITNAEVSNPKINSIPSYYKWAVAASIILLIGSLILNYTFYNKYQTTSKDLEAAQQELQKQQQLADRMSKERDVMSNGMPVVLKGTEKSPDAVAKIYWVKNTGEVYVDPRNLPQTPSGMQYQLWAIVDGKPIDAGMISTENGFYHIQRMRSFGKADAFAITLETKGGNPTPKGEMIVQAKI
ncbi:MAG TPA: anti-sigma factor [Chitinophagaceae bacterium]|nr:anti-sigma factor [Chitinophagaceae bacterium]